MTIEEAKITCQMFCDDCKKNHIFVSCIEGRCANYIKIKALEKQIAKKPAFVNISRIGTRNGVCHCGEHIMDDEKYCSACGQAIDWSEEEE